MVVSKTQSKAVCKDCVAEGVTTVRKVHTVRGKPVPGKRCATHHRARKKQTSQKARASRWMNTYGITEEEYEAIKEAQGGVCYMCQRANGASKALAVDHDHETGYVRGLLCLTDNKHILGHARDDIEFFERCIEYLKSPPAFKVIGKRVAPIHYEKETA